MKLTNAEEHKLQRARKLIEQVKMNVLERHHGDGVVDPFSTGPSPIAPLIARLGNADQDLAMAVVLYSADRGQVQSRCDVEECSRCHVRLITCGCNPAPAEKAGLSSGRPEDDSLIPQTIDALLGAVGAPDRERAACEHLGKLNEEQLELIAVGLSDMIHQWHVDRELGYAYGTRDIDRRLAMERALGMAMPYLGGVALCRKFAERFERQARELDLLRAENLAALLREGFINAKGAQHLREMWRPPPPEPEKTVF